MLCDYPCVVMCVVLVVTNVSLVLPSPSSLPCLQLFCPQQIHPACPCRGHCRQSVLWVSRRMMTTTTTPWGKPCLPAAAAETMAIMHLLTHPLAERLEHQLHHNVFVMLIVLTCLLCCCRLPKMPLTKLAECDLQEIVHILPCFCVGVVLVRCHCCPPSPLTQ